MMTGHEHRWTLAGEVGGLGEWYTAPGESAPTIVAYRCECGAWRQVTTWTAWAWQGGHHVTHEQETVTLARQPASE